MAVLLARLVDVDEVVVREAVEANGVLRVVDGEVKPLAKRNVVKRMGATAWRNRGEYLISGMIDFDLEDLLEMYIFN